MNEPLISVIIPVHNAEKTLPVCLNSIQAQNFRDFELLIIDDYCTDNSLGVVNEFVQTETIRIKVIHHDKNRGVAAARNTGLSNATANYIYFLDADDWLEPDALAVMLEAAQAKKADMVGIEWYLTYKKNERHMKQPQVASPSDAFEKMAGGILRWNLWLYLVNRSLYEDNNIRFIEGLNMGEDMMVTGKLFLHAESVIIVNKPLYHYLQTSPTSLTKDISEKHIRQVTGNVLELERYVVEKKGHIYSDHMFFLKLNIKLPLLMTNNMSNYEQWLNWFPEANGHVLENKMISSRTRLLQWFGTKRQFWLIKLYYVLMFRFVYGIIYR